jgi:hypothetical protein
MDVPTTERTPSAGLPVSTAALPRGSPFPGGQGRAGKAPRAIGMLSELPARPGHVGRAIR